MKYNEKEFQQFINDFENPYEEGTSQHYFYNENMRIAKEHEYFSRLDFSDCDYADCDYADCKQSEIEEIEQKTLATAEKMYKEYKEYIFSTYENTINRFKATDSGRFGKAFEINVKHYVNGKRGNSNRVATKGKTDMQHKKIKYEIKSNCGELTAIERNKYVIYTYDNERDYANPERARVIPSADFMAILDKCGLIRTKKTTNCSIVKAIQSYKNSKRKTAMLTALVDSYPTVGEWFGA